MDMWTLKLKIQYHLKLFKKKKEVLRCEFYKACLGLVCLKVFNADGRYQRRPI